MFDQQCFAGSTATHCWYLHRNKCSWSRRSIFIIIIISTVTHFNRITSFFILIIRIVIITIHEKIFVITIIILIICYAGEEKEERSESWGRHTGLAIGKLAMIDSLRRSCKLGMSCRIRRKVWCFNQFPKFFFCKYGDNDHRVVFVIKIMKTREIGIWKAYSW